MRRPLVQLPAFVKLYGVTAVDVHGTVRVDGHHHLPDVAVDSPLLKPEHTDVEKREVLEQRVEVFSDAKYEKSSVPCFLK